MLIPASHIAVVFFCAAVFKILKMEYEHAVTRGLLCLLYVYFSFSPGLADDTRQILARWFLILLGGIEIISFVAFKVMRKYGNR